MRLITFPTATVCVFISLLLVAVEMLEELDEITETVCARLGRKTSMRKLQAAKNSKPFDIAAVLAVPRLSFILVTYLESRLLNDN